MNILLLTQTLADPGGTQRLLADVGRMLATKHRVWECSFDTEAVAPVFESGNPRLSLGIGIGRPTGRWSRLAGYYHRARALNRLKRHHKIDVTVSALWPADLINALSMGPGRRISLGVVNVVGNFQNARMLRYRRFVAWIYRRFDRTVAINELLEDELRDLYRLDRSRITCVYPFRTLHSGPPAALRSGGRRIAWLGRLNPIKNLKAMLEILSGLKGRVDGVQLVVIGEGPQRQELISVCADAQLRVGYTLDHAASVDVMFLGFVEDPFAVLRQADVFALTSTSEGFGLVLLEAMAAGLPVVASDCPTGGPHVIMGSARPYNQSPDDVEETPFGFLLPVPQPGGGASIRIWRQAIEKLFCDDELRRQKAANGVRRAQDFSPDRLRDAWFTAIESV